MLREDAGMANRLAVSMSPYLRQHADNPVDWWPWCDEAFAEARRRDVPILLSVGYAACHWCHVMAHESFEDPVVAELMNELVVAVKVDREERPDIDAVYMEATQALSGSGGWPMTVFLDHDGRAFYAGTYFPPRPRHGMPSFRDLLLGIDRAWRTERTRVDAAAARLDEALRRADHASPEGSEPTHGDLVSALDRLEADFDSVRGGFGGAPKFPPSLVLEFLLRADALLARAGRPDPRALQMASTTMAAMARGGMYDQLGGGFARYSVDADWVVPHFEKMLYDNALLLRAYLHWWRATGDPLARRVVEQTAEFLLRDLRTPEGGFASSLDADSEGREGACYVWTPDQLDAVLGPADGAWVARLCQVTPAGTFEHGTSVLQLRDEPADTARWERCRAALAHARAEREQPARDDKVVAAWNGLAIAALAEAGALMDVPRWITAAVECAHLLSTTHWDDRAHRLARVSLAGAIAPDAPGVLEDYADLAEGLLTLYQVTGQERWFDAAAELLTVVREQFPDGSGSFFDTAGDAPALVRRPRDPSDGVTPSGASAAAQALLTLSALTGDSGARTAAERALGSLMPLARTTPRFTGWAWSAIVASLAGPAQVALALPTDPSHPTVTASTWAAVAVAMLGPTQVSPVMPESPAPLDPLHRAALGSTAPGLVVAAGRAGASRVPLLAERPTVDDLPTAYPCRGFVCDLPVTTVDALRRSLGD
jgi:uncharacterized protein YyaL (SSP411 family)